MIFELDRYGCLNSECEYKKKEGYDYPIDGAAAPKKTTYEHIDLEECQKMDCSILKMTRDHTRTTKMHMIDRNSNQQFEK